MKRLLAFGRRPAAGIDTLRMSRTYERAAKELSDPANAPAVPPTRMEWLRAKVPRLAQLTGGKRSSLVQPATIDAVAKKYPAREHFTALQDSPRADLRAMHDLAVRHSSCPVCLAAEDRLPSEQWDALETIPGGTGRREPSPKSRERPTFVCPDCGWPTHCSSEHHAMDRERHAPVCASLRQWTIDEHDSSSGRKFWEMTFPAGQPDEAALNFKNWPYVFATRKFPRPLLKSPISQRHVSRYLTYPYTIASMLYNPWTYYDDEGQRKRTVTDSGWHLLSGLSQALDMARKAASKEHLKIKLRERRITFTMEPTASMLTNDPFRIFIVGPRVECLLPSFVWEQLSLTFPGVPFRIYFIGPESLPPQIQLSTQIAAVPGHRSILPATRVHQRPVTVKDTAEDGVETTRTINSMITPINVNLRMEYIAAPYEQVHETFGTFNRRRDVFLFFNSGIGHPLTAESWKPALHKILETRCLMLFTSVNQADQDADVAAVQRECEGEYVVALRPTINKFASMRPDIPVDSVHDDEGWVNCNWGIFGIHGIGKEVGERREDFQVEEKPSGGSWFGW